MFDDSTLIEGKRHRKVEVVDDLDAAREALDRLHRVALDHRAMITYSNAFKRNDDKIVVTVEYLLN